MKRKTPSRCAGAFFIATFAGPEGKGAVCGSRGALAGRKTSPPRAGRFCVATFAGSGGKGHYLGGKSRPRSTRGVFAWRHLTGRAAKGAERGGRYTLADRKTSPQRCGGVLRDNILRAERQRALPAAFDALSRKEKRLRSARGIFAWRHLPGRTAKGAACGSRGALVGEKNASAAAWGHFCVTAFAGSGGKGRCPRQSQHSLRQENIPAAVRGRFCAATFAWPGGKGRCLRRSRRSQGQKRRPRSCAGAFCVTTFAGPGSKARYLGGKKRPRSARGVFRDSVRRVGRQGALSAAVAALTWKEKRLRSARGIFA